MERPSHRDRPRLAAAVASVPSDERRVCASSGALRGSVYHVTVVTGDEAGQLDVEAGRDTSRARGGVRRTSSSLLHKEIRREVVGQLLDDAANAVLPGRSIVRGKRSRLAARPRRRNRTKSRSVTSSIRSPIGRTFGDLSRPISGPGASDSSSSPTRSHRSSGAPSPSSAGTCSWQKCRLWRSSRTPGWASACSCHAWCGYQDEGHLDDAGTWQPLIGRVHRIPGIQGCG